MQDSEYHRRQAAVLIKLAQTTRDTDTAVALMRLAAEHTELADLPATDPQSSARRH